MSRLETQSLHAAIGKVNPVAPSDLATARLARPAYDPTSVAAAVARARRAQGTVEGKLVAISFEQRQEIEAETWAQETPNFDRSTRNINARAMHSGRRSSDCERPGDTSALPFL